MTAIDFTGQCTDNKRKPGETLRSVLRDYKKGKRENGRRSDCCPVLGTK